MKLNQAIEAKCPCGQAQFKIDAMPRTRFFCHCTICQKVYKRDFSDVTVTLAKHVRVSPDAAISFNQYKAPPALDRGICTHCAHPVLGFLKSPGLPRLAFIPTAVLPDRADTPAPERHIHYGTRRRDVDDDLPKTSGELASNLVLLPAIVRVLMKG